MGWRIEYRDPHRDDLSQEFDSREGAIQAVCRHWFKDPKVRVVGPHGEVVQGAEIERDYQTLLDAGKL
jgi:hypothetical protein